MKSSKLIVGNWKMNGLRSDAIGRAKGLIEQTASIAGKSCDIVLCPPATILHDVIEATKNSPFSCGGQDCHAQESGAYTGDISAVMLKDAGCRYVIVGHSERRQYHHETSREVAEKAKAAHKAGLVAIVCVGETDAERSAGRANEVVMTQVKDSLPDSATPQNTVVAYEPVWAIGTGKVASPQDVADMHALIRQTLPSTQLLYGGSVKASNAKEILHTPNVDGVLVGGASLKIDEFSAIAAAST